MTTTPISKTKLSCKQKGKPGPVEDAVITPNKNNCDGDSDYSPIYFPLTQESNEEIDVLWDWHSPQSSHRKRRKQKRLIPVNSPKVPLKRHPSNTQNQKFEELRNELKALQEELAQLDDESCLCLSPQQEVEFKEEENNELPFEPQSQLQCEELDDMFNDSLDEHLIAFSQKVEEENKVKRSPPNCDNISDIRKKYTDNDCHLSNIFESTIELSTQKFSFKRTSSSNGITQSQKNVIETASGKLEFHRTKSFEMAGCNTQAKITKNLMEEIERKRLEAKAKLESKKQKHVTNTSPPQCSSQDIEKKRQQALAKLESKRLQDIVEKKRLEALKKLRENRLKNASHSQVISTLTTRL